MAFYRGGVRGRFRHHGNPASVRSSRPGQNLDVHGSSLQRVERGEYSDGDPIHEGSVILGHSARAQVDDHPLHRWGLRAHGLCRLLRISSSGFR